MTIEPAQLAKSLGALDTLDLEGSLARTLQQVLRSAKTLLDADRIGLMLVDPAGALRWASGSDRVVEARCAELSVPVQVGGGPVGTLDVYVTAARDWDDSAAAALQAYAGLVASLLAAAVTARVTGRLADQLQGALAYRSLIEQAVDVLVDREGLEGPAALEWLGTTARSSGCALVQMARAVVGGAPLPSDRRVQARAQRREATRPRGCRAPAGLGVARGRGPTVRAAWPGGPSADRAPAGGRGTRPDHRRRSRTPARRPATIGDHVTSTVQRPGGTAKRLMANP
jgi:ANTAR domain